MQIRYGDANKINKIITSKGIGFILLGIYLLIDSIHYIGRIFSDLYFSIEYYIVPFVLLMFMIGIQKWVPQKHGIGKMRYKSIMRVSAFNCGVGWLIVSIASGFLFGFGKNPYNRSLTGILFNIWIGGGALVVREYIRSYLINSFYKEGQQKVLLWIILLMTIIQLNINALFNLAISEQALTFCGKQFLPLLGQNILASYLSAYGGMGASLIYLGMIKLCEWSLPILPNANWFIQGIIGIGLPIISLSLVMNTYQRISHQIKRGIDSKKTVFKDLFIDFSCVLVIWFVVGVFTIYPSAIVTGSMKPLIDPGDVILVKKLKSQEELEALKVGEIIQFQRDNILITHRIVGIRENDKTHLKEYQTKGDNNSGVDVEWVEMKNIKGTMEGIIPKIGWPTIWMKAVENKEVQDVEF